MYKKKFIEAINQCKICLSKNEKNNILVEALSSFTDQILFYDLYAMKDSPFTIHFKAFFEDLEEVIDDECYSIYEDLVIMVREKQLRMGQKNLTKAEIALLKDFQNKDCEEDSLVYTWYHYKLPALLMKELSFALNK